MEDFVVETGSGESVSMSARIPTSLYPISGSRKPYIHLSSCFLCDYVDTESIVLHTSK